MNSDSKSSRSRNSNDNNNSSNRSSSGDNYRRTKENVNDTKDIVIAWLNLEKEH